MYFKICIEVTFFGKKLKNDYLEGIVMVSLPSINTP